MKQLDIDLLEMQTGLSRSDIAQMLFPDHRVPHLALQYLISGRRDMKLNEVELLEKLTNMEADMFFREKDEFLKHDFTARISGLMYFKRNDYLAMYNVETKAVVIAHKGRVIHDSYVQDAKLPVKDLLASMNLIINNHIKRNGKSNS